MTTASDGVEPVSGVAGVFATTHWSVVLAAGDPVSPRAAEALEKLCRTYWYPLYAYVRRWGCIRPFHQHVGLLDVRLQLLAQARVGQAVGAHPCQCGQARRAWFQFRPTPEG